MKDKTVADIITFHSVKTLSYSLINCYVGF